MARLNEKILKEGIKVVTATEFRHKYADGITVAALRYAINTDLVDHIFFPPKLKLIALTEKTLRYLPNRSKARARSNKLTKNKID